MPFNSLQCIYDNRNLELVFKNIHQHLTEDGLLIFDLYNPSIELMVSRQIKEQMVFKGKGCKGMIEIYEKSSYD